jgi:CRP/FNR family transcriptional regulator, nitrogen fixation regulation protein
MIGSSSQRIGVVRSYPRKSQIIREDEAADHVYEVVSGTVCTCKMLREGRRQIAGFYFAGDIFGLESAKQHAVAVEAITSAQVRIFKKRALNALASSNLEVADRLLALTTRELARKQDHLLLLLSATAEERIICFLIEMTQRASPREDDRIDLPMSRRDIADYLGLTIETVSRTLWDLERRGAIKIKGYRSVVLRRPRQAADVRRQDSVCASFHCRSSAAATISKALCLRVLRLSPEPQVWPRRFVSGRGRQGRNLCLR